MGKRLVNIVFDGPPGHEAGRFVEVENEKGQSIAFGEWIEYQQGYWALTFENPTDRLNALEAENAELRARIAEQDASPEVAIGSTCEFPGCTSEATVWHKSAYEEAWFLCSDHWRRWREAHP